MKLQNILEGTHTALSQDTEDQFLAAASLDEFQKILDNFRYSSSYYNDLIADNTKKFFTKKVSTFITDEESLVNVFKSNLFYYIDLELLATLLPNIVTKFITDNLVFSDNKLRFANEKIGEYAMNPRTLKLLVKHDANGIESFIKDSLAKLSLAKMTIDFSTKKSSFFFTSAMFSVEQKDSLTGFVQLVYIARVLAKVAQDDSILLEIFKSRFFKHLTRNIKHEILKLTHLTEHDFYSNADLKVFSTSSNAFGEFFKTLKDYVEMLDVEDCHAMKSKILSWFYNLLEHGNVHEKKKDLISAFSRSLSDVLSAYSNVEPFYYSETYLRNFAND